MVVPRAAVGNRPLPIHYRPIRRAAQCSPVIAPNFKPVLLLSRYFDQFVRAHKLIALHRDRDLELPGVVPDGRLTTPQNLPQTPNAHRGVASRQGDQIFNAAANLNVQGGHETNAAGADIAGLLNAIHSAVAQLDDSQGELQSISLSSSLFQDTSLLNLL